MAKAMARNRKALVGLRAKNRRYSILIMAMALAMALSVQGFLFSIST